MSRRAFQLSNKANSKKTELVEVSLLLKTATTKKEHKYSYVNLCPEKGKNKNIYFCFTEKWTGPCAYHTAQVSALILPLAINHCDYEYGIFSQ